MSHQAIFLGWGARLAPSPPLDSGGQKKSRWPWVNADAHAYL